MLHLTCCFSFCHSQLVDLRSTDRTQTLLQYLVTVIQEKFPDVADFRSELQFLEKAATGVASLVTSAHGYDSCCLCAVSLEAIVADVNDLSKSMQMARREHELQPENTVLQVCSVLC